MLSQVSLNIKNILKKPVWRSEKWLFLNLLLMGTVDKGNILDPLVVQYYYDCLELKPLREMWV